MPKFVEIVPAYPHKYPLRYKEDYFLWPAKMMMDRGFDVEFFTTDKGKDAEVSNGIVIRRFGNPFSMISAVNKDKDIRLVHAHLRPYLPSLLSGFSNKPSILTPHTYILGSNPLIALGSVLAMKRFDRVIAITPYERDIYLKAGIKNAVLMPHPIERDFYDAPVNKQDVRKKYGINDEFVVVTVANFRKFKRVDTILKAFKILSQKADSRLIIAGGDLLHRENVPSIAEMIKMYDVKGVIHTGVLQPEQVREILGIADVFVNSSDNETQGLAVYEAACRAVPLCLSNIGSFTTVFGNLALYHDYDNPNKLAENLVYYSNNPKKAAANGFSLRSLMKQWDFDEAKNQMEQLYEQVMGKKHLK